MENSLLIILTMVAFFPILKGNPLVSDSNTCDDWITYKNAKCLKILDSVGLMAQEEAENGCRSLPSRKFFAKLVTIKAKEEQDFLRSVFWESETSANVWLGLKKNKNSQHFEWNDGSNFTVGNLIKPNGSDHQHQCVEMNREKLLVVVSCSKKNNVVCEEATHWPIEGNNKQPKKDCEMNILISEEKTSIMTEAMGKTIDLWKEAQQKIADLEGHEEAATEKSCRRHTKSGLEASKKKISPCGNWIPFKNEKCYKIIDNFGQQTQERAEAICKEYANGLHGESNPRLLTIKTEEEQTFLQHFLFDENQITNNVWLGLKKKGRGNDFEWIDGSKMFFSKWINQSTFDDRHQCTEMESGWSVNSIGLWARVGCKKENVVVCETTQTWTLGKLQSTLLNNKMEYELQQQELVKEIASLKEANNLSEYEISKLKMANNASEEAFERFKQSAYIEINNLKQNTVPIGFIYVQLPTQQPPNELWPTKKWMEISSNYSGLFLRVVGGEAAPFGQIQEGNSPRLEQVEVGRSVEFSRVTVPSDGTWSEHVHVGTHHGRDYRSVKFRLSTSEVRPRNQAVRIWKRIQ